MLADVEFDRELRLPMRSYEYDIARGIVLGAFIEDAVTELETVSSDEGSEGTLTFRQPGCEPGDVVEFEVDATLGSEFYDGEPIRARGTFRGVVGPKPADAPEWR